MSWSRVLLVPLVLAAFAPAAPAGLFSRKPKNNAAERVPELLIQLQTAQDEAQRAAAAEELRLFDAKEFPKISPALVDALTRDASPLVRAEAATTLGKLRPISQQAGYALEQAQNDDAVMRVRLAARQSLWQYHLVGYRGKATDAAAPNTAPEAMSGNSRQPARGNASAHYPGFARESAEPPLAGGTVPPPAARPRTSTSTPVGPTNPARGSPAAPKTTPAMPPASPTVGAPAASSIEGPALPPP